MNLTPALAASAANLMPPLAAVTASVCFGAAVVVTRWVIGETDAITLAFLRYLIATACLAVPLWAMRKAGVPPGDRWPVCILGVVFFGIFPWSFSAALESLSAATGALILGLIPVLTLLLGCLSGREAVTPGKLAGVSLTVAGVVLAFGVADQDLQTSWTGGALMLLAAACAATYNVFSRPYIARSTPLAVASLGMGAGALFLAPWAAASAVWSGLPAFSAQGWLAVAALGTLGGALGFSLWIWALGRISPTRVAVFITLNPATAALLGLLMLGESPGPAFLPGLVAVGVGIALVNRQGNSRLPRPSEAHQCEAGT